MSNNRDNEIGAFWLRESRQGKKYMSGQITLPDGNRVDVVLFRNEYKQEGEKSPDYRLYRSQPREQAPQQSGGGGGRQDSYDDLDDRIPFLTMWGVI